MPTIEELFHTVTGEDPDESGPDMPHVYLASILSATTEAVRFAIPSYSDDFEFGPAPYARPSGAIGNPPRGTTCAVFFDEGDPDKPSVLCLYGWPV